MVRIEISNEDGLVLHEVLTTCVSELRMEIANTDSQDFRDRLKQRKEVLLGVIEQLRAA